MEKSKDKLGRTRIMFKPDVKEFKRRLGLYSSLTFTAATTKVSKEYGVSQSTVAQFIRGTGTFEGKPLNIDGISFAEPINKKFECENVDELIEKLKAAYDRNHPDYDFDLGIERPSIETIAEDYKITGSTLRKFIKREEIKFETADGLFELKEGVGTGNNNLQEFTPDIDELKEQLIELCNPIKNGRAYNKRDEESMLNLIEGYKVSGCVFYRFIKKHNLGELLPTNVSLVGLTREELTIIKDLSEENETLEEGNGGKRRWLVRCSCGTEKPMALAEFNSTRTCGCFHTWSGEDSPNWRGKGLVCQSQWGAIERGAKSREGGRKWPNGVPFEITIEEGAELFEEQEGKCFYTGVALTFQERATSHPDHKRGTASFDRSDSDKIYNKPNCKWTHKIINLMKRDFSPECFIYWCCRVALNTVKIHCGSDSSLYLELKSFVDSRLEHQDWK